METLDSPFDEATFAEHGYPTQESSFAAEYALIDGTPGVSDLSVNLHTHTLDMKDESVYYNAKGSPSIISVIMPGIFNPEIFLK